MPPEINSGDTAWMLAAAALVMFMTPGLGFFYAGFTRSKNVLATIMQSFIVVGLVGVLWVLIGYTLAFGPTEGGIIGKLDFIGFKDVGIIPADKPVVGEVTWAPTIPHEAFAIFQAMFAIITPALITGAFAERAKFSTFLVFMAAWSLLVYAPVFRAQSTFCARISCALSSGASRLRSLRLHGRWRTIWAGPSSGCASTAGSLGPRR